MVCPCGSECSAKVHRRSGGGYPGLPLPRALYWVKKEPLACSGRGCRCDLSSADSTFVCAVSGTTESLCKLKLKAGQLKIFADIAVEPYTYGYAGMQFVEVIE